jgi:hypothetical protein
MVLEMVMMDSVSIWINLSISSQNKDQLLLHKLILSPESLPLHFTSNLPDLKLTYAVIIDPYFGLKLTNLSKLRPNPSLPSLTPYIPFKSSFFYAVSLIPI